MATIKETIAEMILLAIGWVIHLSVLIVTFAIGHEIAGSFDHRWSSPPYHIAAGVLATLAFLWIYEGRKSRERFDALWADRRHMADTPAIDH